MDIEDLIKECGGFGKYQILVVFGLCAHTMPIGWSMLQMSYAGLIPDWNCVLGPNMDNSSYYTNETLYKCSLNNSYTGYHDKECQSYHFEGSSQTVVTEWDLVCDKKYIKATITSIQMAGVLVGAVLSGQLSDLIGRKKTLFGFALLHALLNIGAAFSSSWEMFAVFRFFIGACIGSILCVFIPFAMEFVTKKWRPFPSLVPTWVIGVSIFSLAAYFLDDWSYLHIACGVFNFPVLIGYFYIPESVRWLTLKGHYKEAEKIFEKMAIVNGKEPPKQTRAVLEQIFKEEQESRSKEREYTYLDLFKGKTQTITTLVFTYMWFILSAVYYGMSFGVSALAGNLFLNIFLLSIVELPLQFSMFYLLNRFGRKWTCTGLLVLGVVPACGCWIVFSQADFDSRDAWITGLSLASKMGLGAGFVATSTWIGESYPTVIRSLAFGITSTGGRMGSILAPFVLDFDNNPMLSYGIITSLVVLAIILSFFVPDTIGKQMADSMNKSSPRTEKDDIKLHTIGGNQSNNENTDVSMGPENCVDNKNDIIHNGSNHQQASEDKVKDVSAGDADETVVHSF